MKVAKNYNENFHIAPPRAFVRSFNDTYHVSHAQIEIREGEEIEGFRHIPIFDCRRYIFTR